MYVIKYVIEKYMMGFYLKIQGTLLQRGTKVFEEVLVEHLLGSVVVVQYAAIEGGTLFSLLT